MDVETVLAVTAFGIGVAVTPVYLVLIIKAVRALTGIRNVLTAPLGGTAGELRERC